MTINEYKQILDNLDPSYQYADDHRAFKRGQQAWISASNIAHRYGELYLQAWKEYNDSLLNRD